MVLACLVGGCGGSGESSARTRLVTDTTPTGHVAFGCALQRGFGTADATIRHYGGMSARELFTAALESKHGYALAARLWNASDALIEKDSRQARRALLRVCSDAGFKERVGLPELRSYACRLNAKLIRDRPDLSSFGPESTTQAPGDSRRSDAMFVGTATFLLSLKGEDAWLDGENAMVALRTGSATSYRASLKHVASQCTTS